MYYFIWDKAFYLEHALLPLRCNKTSENFKISDVMDGIMMLRELRELGSIFSFDTHREIMDIRVSSNFDASYPNRSETYDQRGLIRGFKTVLADTKQWIYHLFIKSLYKQKMIYYFSYGAGIVAAADTDRKVFFKCIYSNILKFFNQTSTGNRLKIFV